MSSDLEQRVVQLEQALVHLEERRQQDERRRRMATWIRIGFFALLVLAYLVMMRQALSAY